MHNSPEPANLNPPLVLTSNLVSDPRLREVLFVVLAQLSPLLKSPKLSPSPSNGPTGSQCCETLDLEASEGAHKAEGERLRQARISKDSAKQAAEAKAIVDQLASHRARQEQLKSNLLELESAEAAAVEQFARHHALASAKRLALSRQLVDLQKPDPSAP